ncbi:serine/threonine-protein kinase PknD [Mycobacterium shimoidei]|uniref:non-specific serine/threonine protein kinase n=1 Tax=Mycobacterium shimoidei TaxID=29313 RepID=A0A1E3TG29_MYCSH|nr:serine/threonine-protein kinase PknD [Mycobacterium shimoidei]MCV7257705.1 protein kinase [Mycobacterium shimoidei]ODR13390.1 hypothetical protein BHQ16_10175 [Mycobacterium shimoidei]ORW81539.1 hypothetical protein AWC26_07840 [Mycobacterium shimoidei]SRX92401.1 Transmembrane serine/threonine-protein kinase D PknD (protein kinase D) (STPK D) [Mycobacterium tuberculosis H37Rv] [Mycobacterium shimoidei]
MGQQPDRARVGTQFGRYRIGALRGQAGSERVYEAFDTVDNRAAELTLLPPTADRQRFFAEMRIASRLTHPHLVPVHDWGEIDNVCYAATRLIPGQTLQSLVGTFGPLAPSRAVAIIEQIAAALDAVHADRLIHRNVKPQNILVADDGAAYLLGLGIADPDLDAARPTADSYAYMAPERFDNRPPTNRADIYSLACVLVETLTGARPYPDAVTVGQMIKAHLTAPPPKPSLLRPHVISPRFDAVIARGMAKNPQQRFVSAGDLARAARDAASASSQDAPTMVRRRSELIGLIARRRPRGRTVEPDTEMVPYQDYPDDAAPSARWHPTLMPLAIAVAVLVLTAVGIIVWRVGAAGDANQPAHTPAVVTPSSYRPEVLPFTGLTGPEGVAVDKSGNVYVSNIDNDRVMKLAAGSTKQTVLPFTNLKEPYGLAVDSQGSVYVADTDDDEVVKLEQGATRQTALPFTKLNRPQGLAVDASGTVYVADTGNNRVLKLEAGSTNQTELPFDGLERPKGVAVDGSGAVYVADTGNNRVLRLAAGSTTEEVLPFTGLKDPSGLAADGAGTVYLTDGSRVVRLAAGSNKQTILPVTNLSYTRGVAVDSSGNVYVTDYGNDQVVKLVAN